MALIASYIERCIPLDIGIPGVKLGLANTITLLALYWMSARDAAVILLIRILLGGLLFANGFAILYSMAGGIVSLVVMGLLKKYNIFSVIGVSVAGAIAHNLGQIIVAASVLENDSVFYYIPVLLIVGTICGTLIGILGGILMQKLPKELFSVFLLCLLCSITFTGCTNKKEFITEKTGFAMSTVINRTIYGEHSVKADQQVMERIKEIDCQLSWREPDSEIGQINENAGSGISITVSQQLTGWLEQIQQFTRENPDTVNPLMGPVIDLWNFSQENPVIPTKSQAEKALPLVNINHLLINGNHVSLKHKMDKLDLGAYGKGIACDEVKQILEKNQVQAAMISLGNSSILTYKGKPNGEPWKIGIRHPRKQQGALLGVLSVEGSSYISTSGDYERYMVIDGKRYHHILNPITGYPAESDVCSVTVIGESGLLCDELSTACLILGKEKGMELLERYGAGGIFVGTDGFITEKLGENATFRKE